MSEIKIVYIDDNNDEILTRYIRKNYCLKSYGDDDAMKDVKKAYEEIRFDSKKGYESLLHDTRVRSANVILIDNHLFEERKAETGKFSGKQFKIIIRKLLPYVEVIIITQDEQLIGDNIIHKFSGKNGENPDQYYRNHLDPILDKAIKEVIEFELLADDLRQSSDVEKMLVERILRSLQGDESYDALTKSDIDNLISSFKELKDGYK